MGIKAALYGIRIGQDFIPCEISCELNITREMIKKSGSHGGAYNHYRYGYIDWTITAEANTVFSLLQSSTSSLMEAQLLGREIEVYISARQSNVKQIDFGGTVLIPSQTISFPNSGLSKHNITFQGTGILSEYVDQFDIIINAMPIEDPKNLIYDSN